MLKLSSIVFLIICSSISYGQTWQWTELEEMPFQTANNAVCEGFSNGQEYVYSFGGIDTSKVYSGIHNRSFKYDVLNNIWTELDTLPDAPKIASAASFVNNKVYIIGGYHVLDNGNEISSNKVHVFNPVTDSFEADGANIPVPIDDQVQCVYKDSLIFVVTGWSNNGNVPNVQIYNPYSDSWQSGTSMTSNAYYTAFGASGYIIGDTLYYHGGATGGSFGARKYMRRAYIDPQDPTNLSWSLMEDAPGEAGYRSACSGTGNTIFWVGGSATSYNYDGIAYDGSGGVEPSARILHFNNDLFMYSDQTSQPYGVMDLRGIAKLTNDRWIICGGMDTNQVVSNRTFLLESSTLGLDQQLENGPIVRDYGWKINISTIEIKKAKLVNQAGQLIDEWPKGNNFDLIREKYTPGLYFFIQGSSIKRVNL